MHILHNNKKASYWLIVLFSGIIVQDLYYQLKDIIKGTK